MMMFFAIGICHFFSFGAHVLFVGGINDKFFADRVPGQLPYKLISVPLLVIQVIRMVDNFVVEGL